MPTFRRCVCLLLVLAISGQSIAAVSSRLDCVARSSDVTAVAETPCHDSEGADSPATPSCCDETCPDMTVCAAAHAASAPSVVSIVVLPATQPASHYLLPAICSRLSAPFRPPANTPARSRRRLNSSLRHQSRTMDATRGFLSVILTVKLSESSRNFNDCEGVALRRSNCVGVSHYLSGTVALDRESRLTSCFCKFFSPHLSLTIAGRRQILTVLRTDLLFDALASGMLGMPHAR